MRGPAWHGFIGMEREAISQIAQWIKEADELSSRVVALGARHLRLPISCSSCQNGGMNASSLIFRCYKTEKAVI